MSAEELELAELAQETMNDEDKEEVKPTKNPTTATSQDMVTKVEKVPKVTVQVTKERTENLLSEEETAKEEKKLKVELENELEQEKEEVNPRAAVFACWYSQLRELLHMYPHLANKLDICATCFIL